jgi:hypothetical protein
LQKFNDEISMQSGETTQGVQSNLYEYMGEGRKCNLAWILPHRAHASGNYQIEMELNLDYLKVR